MDHTIIERWNQRVQQDDVVYIIGDICCHSQKGPEWYLKQLTGHKILVVENHDGPILENKTAQHYLERIERLMHVKDGKNNICLCHFPLAEWNGYFRGSWHIYGHIHNKRSETYAIMNTRERALNAGCMINNYVPVSFNELIRNNRVFKDGE